VSTGLSGDTKVGDWFDHPKGGPVLRKMLEENGQSEGVMKLVGAISEIDTGLVRFVE